MFIVDAFVQATFDDDFTVDARLIVRNTETFEIDARLIVRRTHTFLVDGLIQRQNLTETFIVDAFIQDTFTETFEVDSFLQATQTETFLVDAFVQATQTETFEVDAFIQALNQEETFEIDAVVQATFIETFEVDAFVQATQTETFLVDAFVQALGDNGNCPEPATQNVYSEPIAMTANDLVGGTHQTRSGMRVEAGSSAIGSTIKDIKWFVSRLGAGFTGNCFATVRDDGDNIIATSNLVDVTTLVLTIPPPDAVTFTLDKFVVLQAGDRILLEFPSCTGCNGQALRHHKDTTAPPTGWTKTFFTTGTGYNDPTGTPATSELYGGDWTVTPTSAIGSNQHSCMEIDSQLQVLDQEETFIIDGVLIDRNEETFEVDAFLQAEQLFNFLVDGLVQEKQTELFIVDAILQATFIETFLVDGLLRETLTETFLVNAILKLVQTETFEVDARLQATFTETFQVDSILQATQTETFEVDSRLIATQTETFEIDAQLLALNTVTTLVDAELKKTLTETFEVDARLLEVNSETFEIDGRLAVRIITRVDARLVRQVTTDVDAVLKDTVDEDFTIDAVLIAGATTLSIVDAFLVVVNTETFEIDAMLAEIKSETFEVDALLQGLTQEETFEIDAQLSQTNIETFEIDARLSAPAQTEVTTVNALLKATRTCDLFFTEPTSGAGWSLTGNGIAVLGSLISGWGTLSIVRDFQRPIGFTLPDSDWTTEFVWKYTDPFTIDPRHFPFSLSGSTQTGGVTTARRADMRVDKLTGLGIGVGAYILVSDGIGGVDSSAVISGASGVIDITSLFSNLGPGVTNLFYTRFEKSGSTYTLSFFKEEARINHYAGSPITLSSSLNNNGLRHIHTGGTGGGNSGRALDGDLFDIKVIGGNLVLSTNTPPFGCTNVDAMLQQLGAETTFTVNALLKAFNQEETFLVDGNVQFPATTHTFEIDSLLVALGSNGNCPTPATQNIYSKASTTFGGNDPMGVGQQTRGGVRILAFQAGNTIKDVRWNLSRTVGASGNCFATVRDQGDNIISTSPALDVTTITTTTSPPDLTGFTFDKFVTLEEGDRVLIEFTGTGDLRFHKNTSGVPGGFEKTQYDGTYSEETIDAYGGSFSLNLIPAQAGNQHACADVDALLTTPAQEETFQVDAILTTVIPSVETETFTVNALLHAFGLLHSFQIDGVLIVVPSAVTCVDALLLNVDVDEDFFVDAKLINRETETFEVDAILIPTVTNTETFEVDAFLQPPPKTVTTIVDGLVTEEANQITTFVDSILKATIDKEFQIDVHLRLLGEETFEIDAQLVANIPETTTVLVNAIIGFFTKFQVDAFLQATQTHDFFVDAKLGTPVKFTVDALIQSLGDNCASALTFNDPIDNNTGWIVSNGLGVQIRVDGANFPKEIEYDLLGNFVPGFLNKLLDPSNPTIDSFGNYRLEFKYNHLSTQLSGSNGGMLMGITNAGGKIINRARFGARHTRTGGQFELKAQMSDLTTTIETAIVNIPTGVDSYITIEKIGTDIRISAFSDQARTIHIGGSPSPLVSVAGLNQITFNQLGGSGENVPVGQLFIESGRLDDIQVYSNTCKNFFVDAFVSGGTVETFEVDAILVREVNFEVSAFIKAIGDIRCQPSFAEKIFSDDLNDTSNWSDEINNTTVEGWATQRIFIDGESPSSEEVDGFGDTNGFIRMSMKPGGFNPQDFPIFKTKYRRKLLTSEGGIGIINGDNFRLEYEFHQIIRGSGSWIGTNRTGFHPQNDPNTSTFQVNSGNGNMTASLGDGVNFVATPVLDWTPVDEESPDPLFIVVESNGGFLTLNAYNDKEHTIHNGDSPVSVSTASVNLDNMNMKWLFIGANSKGSGPANPTPVAEIDNIEIYANPCPTARVDALLAEFLSVTTEVDAKLVRQVQTQVDAKLRGRKDFEVNAILVKRTTFEVDAILSPQGIIVEFRVDAFIEETFDKQFLVGAQIIKGVSFSVGAIFSTEASAPNFSLTHMQSIAHIFNGFGDKEFTVSALLSGSVSTFVDARLVSPLTIEVDAILSTEPQPLFFSLTHMQSIAPLFAVSQPQLLPQVNALLKAFNFEEDFDIGAKLVIKGVETFEIDSQLTSVQKTVTPFIDSLLKGTIEEEPIVDARLVNRNIVEPFIDAHLFGQIEEEFFVNGILKSFGLIKQYDVNARIVKKQIHEFQVDSIIKLVGEDGFCNFYPATNIIGTGLEQFVGPIAPSHESDVDMFIGQQFNLNNQQVRKAVIKLRGSDNPNSITVPSVIIGKIWSNVIKGDFAGEVTEVTSVNTVDADVASGDLPAGVWKEITFDFGINSPFLTGDMVVGIQHVVGTGVNDPQGVGVAQPVISGGNAIAGEALFRREPNSGFIDPDKWRVLIGDTIDMVINLELINGNEIILGKGKQCPNVSAVLVEKGITDTIVDSRLIIRNIEEFRVDTFLQKQDQEETFEVDAQLVPQKSITTLVDGFLVEPTEHTFFVDAKLLLTPVIPSRVNAILIEKPAKTFLVSGMLQDSFIVERIVDAYIQEQNKEETFTVNAILVLTSIEEFEVDARLKLFNVEETFVVGATLAVTQPPVEFFVNAILKLENFRVQIDALISLTGELETKLDAILTDAIEHEFFVNAILQKFNIDETFLIDSILIQGFQKPFIVDAQLSVINSEDAFVNAILSKDGLISEFTVNAILIRRTTFQIDALKKALGINGNSGGTNALAQNPFILTNPEATTPVPIGTNLCGQRLRLPSVPVTVTELKFRLFRDGLAITPAGTLQGVIYKNSIAGNTVLPADLLDISDNIVNLGDLTTNILGDSVIFTFSTVEIFDSENVFFGIQLTGTNEIVTFSTAPTDPLVGGDFTTTSTATWGPDLGFDVTIEVTIDDVPRQRASAVVNAILGVRTHEFIVDGITKAGNVDKTFIVDAKVVVQKSITFTVGAILIGSVDVLIGAFVGEVQETVLDVESVVVTNNSDTGVESTIGVGEA